MWHMSENEVDRCYQDGIDLCAVSHRVRAKVMVELVLGYG